MGKINAAKAAQKRERNLKKASSSKKPNSQLKTNEAALSFQCAICKQTYLCTTQEVVLKQHAESKHPKKTFKECFPDLEEEEGESSEN
ncbi:hypothetical protein ABK040_012884 [Willaertia magna]